MKASGSCRAVLLAAALAIGFAASTAAPAAAGSHTYLSLQSNEVVHSRDVRLGVNKSMVIELPRPAGDVLVSNPEVADAVLRTSRRLYLIGVKLGQANIFLFDAAGEQIASFDVYVEADLSALNQLLAETITDGWVRAEAMNGNIVLRGEVASASSAARAQEITAGMLQGQPLGNAEEGGAGGEIEKNVVNLLTITGVEQVTLKVTIAEVQREVVKQLGINSAALLQRGGGALMFGTLFSGNPGFSPFSFPFNSNTTPGQADLSWTNGASSVDATLKALEETRLIRTLAEPSLTAVSGETASFLAGGEFPLVAGYDPVKQVTTFKMQEFGVKLAFTPVVLSAGRISMKVKTEVSDVSGEGGLNVGGGFVIPGINARRAETTIELPSGGAFVIAGLVKEETRRAVSGLPLLQKLPILGALFSSKDFQRAETELVVIVTPYLVKPASPKELARPDENLVMANDAEAYFLGRLNKIYGSAAAKPRGTYYGQVGFAFD